MSGRDSFFRAKEIICKESA